MRVSADRADPDWIEDYATARVFLDGVELKGIVITADDVAGVVLCIALDEEGNPRPCVHDRSGMVLETRRGQVRIERPDMPRAAPDFSAINRAFSS